MQNNTTILFNNVCLSINNNQILTDISFDILRGDFVYLFGATGVGKSLLLKAITAQTPISSGKMIVANLNVHQIAQDEIPYLRRKLGVVSAELLLSPYLSVAENLDIVLTATGWKDIKKQKSRITQVLELLKIQEVYSKNPTELTHKEFIKVSIARAILNQPPILLLDDITQKLDWQAAKEILLFVQGYAKDNGTTVLFATSNKQILHQYEGDSIFICQNNTIKELVSA